MGLNGRDDVAGATVMQEERTLAHAPKRSAAEVLSSGIALGHAIEQSRTHVVSCEIAPRAIGNIALPGDMGMGCRLLVLHMTECATDGDEQTASIIDGCSGGCRDGSGRQAHESGKVYGVRAEIGSQAA